MMQMNELLAERGITRYRLAKESGVPHSTLKDICLGKAKIENCSGETLYRLARTLGVSMETLLTDAMAYRLPAAGRPASPRERTETAARKGARR